MFYGSCPYPITAPVPILGVNEYVHTTRLRQQVIAAVPDLVEVKCPSNRTELAFDDDISQALQELADSCDTEAIYGTGQSSKDTATTYALNEVQFHRLLFTK